MRDPSARSSRISGFYKQPIGRRLHLLSELGLLSTEATEHLRAGGGLEPVVADRMIENVIAIHGLPLGIALNFRINQRDVLVPMAIEEPSVVAAASNAARMVRVSGGFSGKAMSPIMTAQIQLDNVPAAKKAAARLALVRDEVLRLGDTAVPTLVARGGGCRDLEVRVIDEADGLVVVHVHVKVGNAMGANLVDAVAEAVAPFIQDKLGGQVGLRILTNLPLHRMVKVRAKVSSDALGGARLADGIARASLFAEKDMFRAVTHNKGIMNGIDAVAVALGQDWRSIEAAAHAYASLSGTYRPLAVWTRTESGLQGVIELPLSAATVGGSTRVHPGVRAAFELVSVKNAQDLAVVMASVGLASNLAALRALAGEGIQKGHMKLHRRKKELEGQPALVEGVREGGVR